jgi:predicted CoA-substrate-specific enzyme activase
LHIGINIGSISVKFVELEGGEIVNSDITLHQGQPNKILEKIINTNKDAFYGVSGYQGHISEAEAIERGLLKIGQSFDAIISLGGEAFAVYLLRNNKIFNVLSHNRCAAGSGEFLIQQVGRLNLSLDDAIKKAKDGQPIKIASRCSVHCKSDITHKLNKQEATVEDILYSVHDSMVLKVTTLLEKSNHPCRKVLVIGGLSRNEVMVNLLQKSLSETEVVVLPESPLFEALGTALMVEDNPVYKSPELLIKPMFDTLDSLISAKHLVKKIENYGIDYPNQTSDQIIVMGIDGGSTTTKISLLELPNKRVLASHYTRTNGDPLNATKECISEIMKQYGDNRIDLIATTGSAREIIGAFIGTSAVYNEISAHTKGAVSYEKDVDTIFEIGGQDAKYIYLENGSPIDYAMNAACSAGTGSFLEESAQGDLGVSVFDISKIALVSKTPVRFKADCAAFINSDIRTALQEGYGKEDIIGGLVASIVNNYLTKVKGPRKVGKKIFLQGGVAKNEAIAYAFAHVTGKQIIIPPNPELMGAYGVALIAYDRYISGNLELHPVTPQLLIDYQMDKLDSFICRACDNYCSINRYRVGDRKFPFGGKCSKYESQWKNQENFQEVPDYIEKRNNLVFSVLNQELPKIYDMSTLTIGIPKALSTHFLFPLYYTFLNSLGFKVVLSEIDEEGELTVNAPFCFPTQIAHGAVLDLIKRKTKDKIELDYIFFPQIQKMPHQGVESSYLCPITQASPFILRKAFNEVEFLSPSLNFIDGYESCTEIISFFENKFHIPKLYVQKAYLEAIDSPAQSFHGLFYFFKHVTASAVAPLNVDRTVA